LKASSILRLKFLDMADRYLRARKFLKHIGLFLISGFAVLAIANLKPLIQNLQVIAQPIRSEIRGVWMTNNDLNIMRDRPKLNEALTQLKKLNFNTIYPVVWNSGYVMYPSVTAQNIGIQPFLFKGT
jgi:uncharacterized lipoprotein YddW (UPF0748 family)